MTRDPAPGSAQSRTHRPATRTRAQPGRGPRGPALTWTRAAAGVSRTSRGVAPALGSALGRGSARLSLRHVSTSRPPGPPGPGSEPLEPSRRPEPPATRCTYAVHASLRRVGPARGATPPSQPAPALCGSTTPTSITTTGKNCRRLASLRTGIEYPGRGPTGGRRQGFEVSGRLLSR